MVKNRQLRRDAQALRSALFSFPFAEKRRAGTSAGDAETAASAPRRRVSPTATPTPTSTRPRRVGIPTARPRAGETRDGDPDGATCESDEAPRETREEKDALFDCETYLSAVGVPAGLPPLRVSYRVPSACVAGTPGFPGPWRPEEIESLPVLHDEDRRKAYQDVAGLASGWPRRRRRDTVVDEPATSATSSNVSNASLLATNASGERIVRVSPGARFSARRDLCLAAPPRVDWSHLRFGGGEIGRRRRFTLLMIDPDAPAPRSTRRRYLPGAWGPYLHWLVTDIEADAFTPFAESETTTRRAKRKQKQKQKDETAREETTRRAAPRVSYVGPSPPGGGGAHRLTFVLFEQGDERSVTSVPPGLAIDAPPSARRRWDIEGFLAANAHLTPKAVSVLYCAS